MEKIIWSDHVRNEKNVEKKHGGEKYPTVNKKLNVIWFGRNLCRNCLLEHVMKENIE